MPEWIVTLFGESLAPIVWVVIVAAMVCLLAVALITIARKLFGNGGLPSGFKGRAPRLAILDMTRVDEKRKLVLVRRDDVEHLLLIGGQSDIVVEPGIVRPPASSLDQVDTRSEGLADLARSREALEPKIDRGARNAAAGRGGDRAKPATANEATAAPQVEAPSPIASPSPIAEPRPAPQRGKAPVRRDPPPFTSSAGGDIGAGAEVGPSRASGKRLSARPGNPIESATAALAAAMPGLLRSRSEHEPDMPNEDNAVRPSAPRSLATPTLPTPPLRHSLPSVATASTSAATARSDQNVPAVSLESRQQRSSSPPAPERASQLSPVDERAERTIPLVQTDDRPTVEAYPVSAQTADRRGLSAFPSASAFGQSRLAAVSVAAGEDRFSQQGSKAGSGAQAGDDDRPSGVESENGEPERPRMPLSVKSFATAIQNRKTLQPLGPTGRSPAPGQARPAEAPASRVSASTDEVTTQAARAMPVPPRDASASDQNGAPASSSMSAPAPNAQDDELRMAGADVDTTQTPSSPVASVAIENDELDEFLAAELSSGFSASDETAERETQPRTAEADRGSNPDGDFERSASNPASASDAPRSQDHQPALLRSGMESAERADTSAGTGSAPLPASRQADRTGRTTSNWSDGGDRIPDDPSSSTPAPVEAHARDFEPSASEPKQDVDWPSVSAVSPGTTGKTDAAPSVELTDDSRIGAPSPAPGGSDRAGGAAATSGAVSSTSGQDLETEDVPEVEADPVMPAAVVNSRLGGEASGETTRAAIGSKPSSYATRLQSDRKRPDDVTRPRLSLEEEMERLLGDFSFDEPDQSKR